MEKEQFINSVLNSIDRITKAAPSEAVFGKIEQKINQVYLPTNTLWLVAASIVVLISLNLVLLKQKFNSKESEIAGLEHSINLSNQIYK